VGDTIVQAGRREERKAQNRAKLLAAARKVFAEKGLGEATARDIVRETDLATGTFYNYFRDKEEVFRALLSEFEERVRDATLPTRRDTSTPLEQRIEEGARAFFRVVADDAELFQVLRRNAGAYAFLPMEKLFDTGMEEFQEDLAMWRRKGDLPGIDVDYLSAAIAGIAMQIAGRMIERTPPDPDGAAEFMSRSLMGMIGAMAAEPSATG
jgi:AcrR family transcriptional regulator